MTFVFWQDLDSLASIPQSSVLYLGHAEFNPDLPGDHRSWFPAWRSSASSQNNPQLNDGVPFM